MNNPSAGASRSSAAFFTLFFLLMCVSIGLTYYYTVVREDFTVFTDPDAVPSPTDFFAYLVTTTAPYLFPPEL